MLAQNLVDHEIAYNPHGTNIWNETWVAGTYQPFDQVIDQDWLMIANKETTDRAAPQPTGIPAWILPTNPAWTPQAYVGIVYSGLRILPQAGRIYAITEVRVWLPNVTADAHYRVFLIDRITGNIVAGSPFLGTVLVNPGWYPVNVDSQFIQGGDDVEVVLESYNSAASTDFNHPWLYAGSIQGGGDPGTGVINHDNQQNLLRISNTDDDAVDRTAQLQSVTSGTLIRVAEEGNPTAYLDYQVALPLGLAGWHDFNVTLLGTGAGGPLPATRCTVSFNVPVHASTDYVEIPGQYLGDPVLFGVIAFDDSNNPTFNDFAYGVDVQFQDYIASPDWDYQAFSGSPGGSASARNNRSISQSRVWFERWLPVELDRLADGIQGTKWTPPMPPPDNATVLRLNQFVGYVSGHTVDVGKSRLWQELEWLESVEILDPGRAVILIEP